MSRFAQAYPIPYRKSPVESSDVNENIGQVVADLNTLDADLDTHKDNKSGNPHNVLLSDIVSNAYKVSDGDDLAAKVAAAGTDPTTLVIHTTITLDAELTVPANVTLHFLQGGTISVADTKTLTINGPISAGLWPIFAGDGDVVGSPKIEAVYPEWFGAKGDGVTDDTDALQLAISTFANVSAVQLQGKTYLVDAENPLLLEDNTSIVMLPLTNLKALPNGATNYAILKVIDKSNVLITGGRITGERDDHTGTEGEWGYGIEVRGSSHIFISDVIISDCWGDGIVLGKASTPNSDIHLTRVICDNNRRQGCSVSQIDGLWIDDCVFKNTNGTLPESGIDFEPDTYSGCLKNIWIKNVRTENNNGAGIMFCLNHLNDESEPISVNISGHLDDGSEIGLCIGNGGATLDGFFSIRDSVYWNNKANGIYIQGYSVTMPPIHIYDPTIINCNKLAHLIDYAGSGLSFWRSETSMEAVPIIGNVHVYNPYIMDTRDTPLMEHQIFVHDYLPTSTNRPQKITINGTFPKSPVRTGNSPLWINAEQIDLSLSTNEEFVNDLSTNETLSCSNLVTLVTDNGLSGLGARALTLSDNCPIGTIFTAQSTHALGYLRVCPSATAQIYPLGTGLGKYVQAPTQKGATATFKKISETEWLILSMVGTWVAEA